MKKYDDFLNEEKVVKAVLGDTEFSNILKALVRGEEAEIYANGGNIKMILSDIGFDEILRILDETKKDVERQKRDE